MIPGYQISGHQRWPIEQGYKQVKDELGWADFQVRSDIAIRRHPPRRRFPEPATGRGGPRPAGRPSRRAGPGRSGHSARLAGPWITLQRWWTAWSNVPPPPQL